MIIRLSILAMTLSLVVTARLQAAPGDLLYRIENPNLIDVWNFGGNMEVVNDRLVVGFQLGAGIAYIFDDQGQLVREIPAPDQQFSGNFGAAIAGNDDHIFISAPGLDVPRTDLRPGYAPFQATNIGRVYVYDRDGNIEGTVDHPDPGLIGNRKGFGGNLAATNDTLIIDTRASGGNVDGLQYIYDAKSLELQRSIMNTENYHNGFGDAVVTTENRAIFSAPWAREDGWQRGQVLSFSLPSWELDYVITNPDPWPASHFDSWALTTDRVDVADGRILVGASGSYTPTAPTVGHVDVFDIETGELMVRAYNPWSDYTEAFGFEVEGYGEDFLTSALLPNTHHATTGLFDGTTGELILELVNPGAPGFFGSEIEVLGDQILVSDPFAMLNGVPEAGVIYVFEGIPEPGSATLLLLGGLILLGQRR